MKRSQMKLTYTSFISPLGWVLLATTERGLGFVGLGDVENTLAMDLAAMFPQAALQREARALVAIEMALRAYLAGNGPCAPLPLDAPGTRFQQQVWAALTTIPYGETRNYGQIAAQLGLGRGAARAVGAACKANPVALVIPCHRVIGSDGQLHGFRAGLERKRWLLALEQQGRV